MNTNKVRKFNSVVENVKKIVREARHIPGISNKKFEPYLINFCNFMDDVNFKVSFVDEPEDYLHDKMLDAMDYIRYTLMENAKNTIELNVYNSIYDAIREWYFNY